MIRNSPLLLLILVSFTDHVGSVVLTRSPLTASDGELFILICSSNTSSGQDRQWYGDDVFVFTTTQGSSRPSISNLNVFQTYLAGRVNVSCDVLQHNVTLRIKSDRDNGTRWKCVDNLKDQTSHTVTIRSNSLQLTSSPATALPDQPFTLMCSSNSSGGRSREWYWRNDVILRTRYVSDTQCAVDVSNNDLFNYLSGRINVTCSHNRHNVTLQILTSIDNGSVWWCEDSVGGQESNRLTIRVVNLMTVSPTTKTAATTATTGTSATTATKTTTAKFDISSSTSLQGVVFPLCKDAPNVVYIAVGAAVGGAVVGCVFTIIVVIIWMRRRNTSKEDDESTPNIYTSPSHYEDMGHQYGKVERQYVNTVEDIGSGSPDSLNKEDQAGSNSLQLASYPATESPDQPYTLMCSSNSSGGRSSTWYWKNDIIFRSRYVSDTQCGVDVSQPINYRHLSGRVNVTCSHNLHNVTLRIITSIDNGSVWWCVDTAGGQASNRLTIHVTNLMTASSTTTTTAATTTTTVSTAYHGADEKPTSGVDAPNVAYIAVGAAVGGAVVGCVITIIVLIMCMRRKNTSTEDDESTPNIYTSSAHYEDMGHQYGKVERQYINTGEVSRTGSPDSVNTEDQAGNAAYYNTAGQHQHRVEDADTGDTTYYNTARDADN